MNDLWRINKFTYCQMNLYTIKRQFFVVKRREQYPWDFKENVRGKRSILSKSFWTLRSV